jgi:RHS repeat-associated protein
MTDAAGGLTQYTYDTLNRLMNIEDFQQQNYGFGYDALSRRTSLTRPNSVETKYVYDAVSRLTSTLHELSTTVLDGATYTYDSAENRKSKTDKRTGVASNFTYDPIYELMTAKQGSATKESYTYDAVGNRLSSLGVSPYSNNTYNELTSIPGVTYGYDNNGNLTSKQNSSGTTNYQPDAQNRLTSVTLPGTGGTVSYQYDPFGRRIQKVTPTATTIYVYDGPNVIEEVDQNGVVLARYTQGANVDEPLAVVQGGATSYYEADGLGSITSLSNSAGALANTYTYDSYGKLTASTGTLTNPFQYTGREFDSETGLYYYRARYYDQSTGRFISQDPVRFTAGMNSYSYVRNNPVLRIDPSGLIHQAWNESPFDGRLHDDAEGGLEVLCTKGRNIQQDKKWLERSIFVRSVEIGALGNRADAGHVERLIKEIVTLQHCHEECDKDKKPEVPFETPPEWNTNPNPWGAAAVAAAEAAAALAEEYGWVVVFSF